MEISNFYFVKIKGKKYVSIYANTTIIGHKFVTIDVTCRFIGQKIGRELVFTIDAQTKVTK